MLGDIQFRVGDWVPSYCSVIARGIYVCVFFTCPLPASSQTAGAPPAALCDTSSTTSPVTTPQTPPTQFYGEGAPLKQVKKTNSVSNILYASNRRVNEVELNKSFPDYDKVFNDAQGSEIAYGCVAISVPQHHIMGRTERQEKYTVPAKDGASSIRLEPLAPSRHFFVRQHEKMDAHKIADVVARNLTEQNLSTTNQFDGRHLPADDVFIYVHGLNNTFQDAGIRLAQLLFDTGFENPAIFFSWPAKYNSIEQPQTAGHSYGDFTGVFSSVFRNTAARINLLGHSHGANFVLQGLNWLSNSSMDKDRLALTVIAHGDTMVDNLTGPYAKAVKKFPNSIFLLVSNDEVFELKKKISEILEENPRPAAGQLMYPIPGTCLVSYPSKNHSAFATQEYAIEHLRILIRKARRKNLGIYFADECESGVVKVGQ